MSQGREGAGGDHTMRQAGRMRFGFGCVCRIRLAATEVPSGDDSTAELNSCKLGGQRQLMYATVQFEHGEAMKSEPEGWRRCRQ